jgi:hypothetical protein
MNGEGDETSNTTGIYVYIEGKSGVVAAVVIRVMTRSKKIA